MSENYLLWMDIETTGLDENKHVILEVAYVLTHGQKVIGDIRSHIISRKEEDFLEMSDTAREFHTNNGLIAECLAVHHSQTVKEAERQIENYIHKEVPDDVSLYLAGTSVHFDRCFMSKYMTRINHFFHYRLADVSSFFLITGIERPELVRDSHRAIEGVQNNLALFAYCNNKVKKG